MPESAWKNLRKESAFLVMLLLAAVMFYLLNLGEAQFDDLAKIAVGWVVFGSLMVFQRLNMFKRMPWRILFILLCAYLALRYLHWRTFETLVYNGVADFIGMSLLYLAEIYGMTVYLLGMFVNLWPKETKLIPLPEAVSELPTVDVFIPTYNEPESIVLATVSAAMQINYPREKLAVYILDDGGTTSKRNHASGGLEAWRRRYRLKRIARDVGAKYITRESNRSAKAGNLNHALQYTKGDIILVLDCDHVPTKDILDNTVGQFIADEKLCLVQTPHFFINPGPPDKVLAASGSSVDESEMFYRIIHPGLDSWNASYFCGSAALLRRSHLLEVGGISGSTITEDAETGLRLHSRGYRSVYVNRPMVCGLSPESYNDYIIQRTRWAQGMVQILMLNNPLLDRGLSIKQKLCYINSCLFWFFGVARIIYYIAPSAFLIFGMAIYYASWPQILSFALPYVFSTTLLMHYFYSVSRRPFVSEIYETLQSIFLLPAVVSALINPRKPTFKVTPKGSFVESEYLNPLAVLLYIIVTINVIAFVIGAFRWHSFPEYRDVITVTIAWCGYNIILGTTTLGAFWERQQIRRHARIAAHGKATVHFPRLKQSIEVDLIDKCMEGVSFKIPIGIETKDREDMLMIARDSFGNQYHIEGVVIRAIVSGNVRLCGAQFRMTSATYPETVGFVFGDSQSWVNIWEDPRRMGGTMKIIRHLFGKGLKGMLLCVPMTLNSVLKFVSAHFLVLIKKEAA